MCDDDVEIAWKPPGGLPDHGFGFVITANAGESSCSNCIPLRDTRKFATQNRTSTKCLLDIATALRTASVNRGIHRPHPRIASAALPTQRFGFIISTMIDK